MGVKGEFSLAPGLRPPPLRPNPYTQISKQLVNKTLLIVEDCNKQDEKG